MNIKRNRKRVSKFIGWTTCFDEEVTKPLEHIAHNYELTWDHDAQKFEEDGLKTVYPGLASHPSHELFTSMMNKEYGYGGMLTIDVGSLDKANALMELMQDRNLGYLAVSLGFYKTLFSAPGTSTSSEIPEEEQIDIGLTDGLIRFSIGLDNDIERTYRHMKACMISLDILKENTLV